MTDRKVVEVPVTNNLTADNVGVINTWAKGGEPRYIYIPYLFPLSSMTSKQKAELSMIVADVEDIFKSFLIEVEFYHKHHFDYRGLIEKSLALDATNLGIYK